MSKDHTSRRTLFGQAGSALTALSVSDSEAHGRACRIPDAGKPKVIVAGGHPGDPEYGCGGTIARFAQQGSDVVLLYLNRGEGGIPGKTGREAAVIRTDEAQTACRILGARPLFAGQIDGHAVVDSAHYDAFSHLIEAERPDILFTHWPIDNHADHRAISLLCYEAWIRQKRRFALYYYEVTTGEDTVMFSPTEYVDITSAEPLKRKACYAHASQSPDRFYSIQDQTMRFRGVESGFKLAEGFVRHVQSRIGPLPGSL